jgi:hypothetical protein
MTGVIKVNELQGRSTANDITVTVGASATQSMHDGLIKMFGTINFGTSAAPSNSAYQTWTASGTFGFSEGSSLNLSSAVDDGTGLYEANFTNSFSNRFWSAYTSVDGGGGTFALNCPAYNRDEFKATNKTLGGIRNLSDNALNDRTFCALAGLGDLA